MILKGGGLTLSLIDVYRLHNDVKIVGSNQNWPNEDTSFWTDTIEVITSMFNNAGSDFIFIPVGHIPILYKYLSETYVFYPDAKPAILPRKNTSGCSFCPLAIGFITLADNTPVTMCGLLNDLTYSYEKKCTPEELVKAGTLEIIAFLKYYKPPAVSLTMKQKFELWRSKWLRF